MAAARHTLDGGIEAAVGRLLAIGTYASITLLVAGTVLLLAEGRSPLDVGPAFDLAAIAGDILALRAAGFLWLGILGILATPSSRVAVALVGYARRGESRMVAVAAAILVVLIAGVVAGIAAG